MDTIDYEALLKKYIEHVVDCESVDFLSEAHDYGQFTTEELAALQRLSKGD